jgi:anti-sigma B factor antagonist
MSDLKVSDKLMGDYAIVKISGELYPKMVSEILEKTKRIILDFSHLEYICSAAVGYIVAYNNQASDAGGRVIVTEVNQKIKKILEIIGFPRMIDMTDSMDEAVDMMQNDIL